MHNGRAWIAGVATISLLAVYAISSLAKPTSAAKRIDTSVSGCTAVDSNATSTRNQVHSCELERGEDDRRLFELATSQKGDPILEAKRAADAGDFRLIGYSMIAPGIAPAAYGIACRPSIVSQGTRMVRALYAASDVPPISEADADNRRRIEEAHRRFGERYNATLMADIRFPFRKMCRLVSRASETEGGPFHKD